MPVIRTGAGLAAEPRDSDGQHMGQYVHAALLTPFPSPWGQGQGV